MQTYSLFSDEIKERGEEFFKEETEQSEEYKAFLKKFEGKKTTDDCFTPPLNVPPLNVPKRIGGNCQKQNARSWRTSTKGSKD